MESDRYICVRETSPHNSIVIIDMAMPSQPLRRPITADSALMNPNTRILALKAQIPGTTQDHLQIFNIEAKTKVKSHQMPVQVVFWKWITPKLLGLVTQTSVYHWSIEGDSEPAKMFDRTANLANNQIINYRCDPAEKWLMLIGIAPGAPERPQLVKGNMQLFSVGQQRSQALEAHAASFATIKVPGNENPSTLICFASKATNAGQITSKLTVAALGAQPGKPGFSMQQADLLFPPDFQDDFPVAMQISQKYGLVYLITKLGLLFVYDLETATPVYRNRISPDPIFLTAESSTTGGFYAITRRGQVLHATVNDATLVTFVSGQLNNLELAVNLAKRANLPGAENLFYQDDPQESTTPSKSSMDGPSSDHAEASRSSHLNSYLSATDPMAMTIQELHRITDGFSEKRLLGKGGFGTVYKGIFDNGEVIAVKKLHNMPGLVEDQFKNELLNLMAVKHQNIIRLVGYCSEAKQIVGEHEGKKYLFYREERALCLEYLQGGNLEELLSDGSRKIDWEECYKIIKGICQGINHLHTGSKDPIYHLDLKPANILLDRNRIPKIGDFGLSRLLPSTETFVTKTYSGTTLPKTGPRRCSQKQC
ncbi:hypothetical protein QYE76_027283 [Lolium multiflorum]|uniref:Protein kinase domain-containing protein n=1 Tax=Lolium multiflorum TaxID=4521 RepID=A0AAD8VDU3_LOLMU|nr:hypothetical protein QYE76_027283 [Lolium multiflorum]